MTTTTKTTTTTTDTSSAKSSFQQYTLWAVSPSPSIMKPRQQYQNLQHRQRRRQSEQCFLPRIVLVATLLVTVSSFSNSNVMRSTTTTSLRPSSSSSLLSSSLLSSSRKILCQKQRHSLHHSNLSSDRLSIMDNHRRISTSSLWTMTLTNIDVESSCVTTDTTTSLTNNSSYDPFATANKIEPQTKPLTESMSFYAQYIINYFFKTPKLGKKIRGQRRAMWKKLNQQRKNVMTLAGYTTSIVAPSFGFLFLGALMSSIVPSYWGKCIQCVATLSATKEQLLEAIIGLGVTSTLAALFTGIRGSLFWIGGKSMTHFMIVGEEDHCG
jgi:hypothetical protein